MAERDRKKEPVGIHPGTMVAEYLEFNEWSQRELARRAGLTPKTVSEICNGKARISPSTALALESVFRRPAHFWLNLQARHDEALAREDASASLPGWTEWARGFPIAAMKRFRLLEIPSPDDATTVGALLTFFGVSSPDSWRSVWRSSNIAYRQTRQFETNLEAVSAWIRATEIAARNIPTAAFDASALRSLIPELRRQTREGPEVFVPEVQRLCAAAGIAVVWVPELPHTGISGSSQWITDGRALVALTLRYKTDDQMWFTFFHELGHIFLHRKRHTVILDNAADDLRDGDVDPEMQQMEEEASRFAADTLVPPAELSKFISEGEFSNVSIKAFANDLTIGPGLVIGRLQHEGVLQHFQGNRLKRQLDWAGMAE